MNSRDKLIKKNIISSFIVKGWSGIIQLLLVPLTLNCINQYEYGIWMTIASILVWIDSFDIGLGNGLRNKLAEFLAKEDFTSAKKVVSTTFIMLIIIITVLWLSILVLSQFFNFYKILNVQISEVPQLPRVLFLSFSIVCATFIFKFIGNLYLGLQLPAINNIIITIGQTLILTGILICSHLQNTTLLDVAVIYTFPPLIVYIAAYPITFCFKYKKLAPSISFFEKTMIKDLFSMGLKFFLIQISGVVIFFAVNLIISNYFSPIAVTPYQIVFRYFTILTLAYTIIMTPFWSATTDAYTKNDISWIKQAVHNVNKMLLLAFIVDIGMVYCAPVIYKIWIGNKVFIPYDMNIYMGIYAFIIIWSMSYSNLLNGLGYLRLQIYNILTIAIIFIPLSYFLCKIYNVEGMIITMCIINISGAALNTIQFYKIIQGRAKGIWKK